jgi:hypothetical protein
MSQMEDLETPVTIAPMTEASPLLRGWWRLVDMRIGIIPLPLFPLMLALMAGFVWLGKLPPELTMMIPLIALGAYVCAEIGKSIPTFAISEAPRSSRPSCHSTWSTRIFQSRGPRSPQ